jgi:hypothetical protein
MYTVTLESLESYPRKICKLTLRPGTVVVKRKETVKRGGKTYLVPDIRCFSFTNNADIWKHISV